MFDPGCMHGKMHHWVSNRVFIYFVIYLLCILAHVGFYKVMKSVHSLMKASTGPARPTFYGM